MIIISVLIFILAFSTSHAGIEGSLHDMRPSGLKTMPCIYCHTPYIPMDIKERWADNTEERTWVEGKKKKGPLLRAARICLGCHDGNIAMDSIVDTQDMKRIKIKVRRWQELQDSGFKVHGKDKFRVEERIIKVFDTDQVYELTDHPVGIRQKDIAYIDPYVYKEPINPSLRLFKGVIDCSTCHSVHNTTVFKPFLAASNLGSELCLSCHRK